MSFTKDRKFGVLQPLRQVELKHGRECMLASMGYIAPRIGDSMLTLVSYAIKARADPTYGWRRPVYCARFLQWSVAVPVLVLLAKRAFVCHLAVWEQVTRTAPTGWPPSSAFGQRV